MDPRFPRRPPPNRLLALVLLTVSLSTWSSWSLAQEPNGDTATDAPPEFSEEITVRARPLQQIDERARDVERRSLPLIEMSPSDDLGRFPDRDAAGAAQRLPGVTVIRDQGDARLVIVRGLLPAYNSATLDGERLPAGEADERVVALDVVPTELLESVEVTKTLTPAQDGDALGGVVNLVTKGPPPDRGTAVAASLGAGHDDGSDGDRSLAAATIGGWLGSSRQVGLSLSTSHLDAERGVDSIEREWELDDDGGFELAEERRQDHTSDRQRDGVGGTLEWRPASSTTFLVRGLRTEYEDQELRRARVEREEDGALLSELKDRGESQTLASLSASGQVRIGDWLLEPAVSWSHGEESEPARLDTIFAAEASALSAEDYELEAFRTESDASSNEDLVGRLDLSRSLDIGSNGGWTLRTGAKWRQKDARRDDNLRTYEATEDAAPVLLSEIVDPDWRPADPFFGGGDLGPFPDPAGARDLLRRLERDGLVEGVSDPEEDLGDFEAEEDVSAAYVLLEGALTDRVSLLGGLRVERTETSYAARELLLNDEGEVEGTTAATGSADHDELLPSVILRAAATERDVLRVALTRGLARPNLSDLTPARLVVPEDEEILAGNPLLVPTTSWNFDLQWQRDFDSAEDSSRSISLALYRKELSDVIALVRTPTFSVDGSDAFTLVQPRNAGDASITGVELSWRSRVGAGPLEGLGLAANATWASSDADLLGRGTMSVPGQADVSGSLVLSYEGRRVSARCLYSYRDEILEELGESPERDLYLEGRGQLDLSIQVRTSRRWSLFAEAFNLTGEDVRQIEGAPADPLRRPVLDESVGWWATVGVRFDY